MEIGEREEEPGEMSPDLRRTFGRLARMAGADLRFIQKARGHESIVAFPQVGQGALGVIRTRDTFFRREVLFP
ncbi:hypothetical protein N801_03190 [Knoellia aerolata DSM 18566]|uniref:Uncharacterized protein n=1 Tax=Knoellia aerolata DSM 18566 TaxID=1385519 RepID=A0A0A0K180_9MICO|nr:hypothetical protein N801_03190 [Knoellia aerolata DSM 18566]